MKILTLSNLYPPDIIGGYEVACRQVVEGLIDRGHDVLVLTSAPRQPVDRVEHVDRRLRLADEWNANAMGFYSITHLTTHAHSRFIDAHNVHELLDVIVTFDPDVAYLGNLAGIGGLGLLATLQQSSIPWCWQLGDCIPTRLCSSRKKSNPRGSRFEDASSDCRIGSRENVPPNDRISSQAINSGSWPPARSIVIRVSTF